MDQDLVQTVAQGCSGVFSGCVEPALVLVDWDSESQLECFVSAFEKMSGWMATDSTPDLLGQQPEGQGERVLVGAVGATGHDLMLSECEVSLGPSAGRGASRFRSGCWTRLPGDSGSGVEDDLTKFAGLRIQF